MDAVYTLKPEELNADFLKIIKTTFKNKTVQIAVSEYDETDYLNKSQANREFLLEAIESLKNNEPKVKMTVDELEKMI